MNMQTTTDFDFQSLAKGAAYCAQYGGSFVLSVNGDVHDSYDDLTKAADMFADLWGEDDTLTVREYAPSGNSVDVTAEAMRAVEAWCDDREEYAPWDEVVEGGMSNHDFQRQEAMIAGHFS